MAGLKRCPFCGGDPKTNVRGFDVIIFSVVCTECGIKKTIPLKTADECNFLAVEIAMDKVCKLWNTRIEEDK